MQKKLPLILVLVLLVLGAAYFFSRKQPKLAEKSEQQVAIKEMLADCKYDKEICTYFAAQAKAMESGVAINTSSEIKNYGVTNSEMKNDGAGNTEMNTYKDGKLESSMIIFEKVTYLKDVKDNSWYALNVPADTAVSSDDVAQKQPKDFLSEIKSTYNGEDASLQVKKVATEACGSLTCDKYEILSSVDNQTETSYLWLDTKEHLARKMEFSFAGGVSTMEYQYGIAQISKPSPIKEMPSVYAPSGVPGSAGGSAPNSVPGSAGVGAAGSVDPVSGGAPEVPSQEEIDQMMKDYSLDGQ